MACPSCQYGQAEMGASQAFWLNPQEAPGPGDCGNCPTWWCDCPWKNIALPEWWWIAAIGIVAVLLYAGSGARGTTIVMGERRKKKK